VLADVGAAGFGSRDDKLRAGFDGAELGVSELKVFVDVVDQGEAFEGRGMGECDRRKLALGTRSASADFRVAANG
jgi:hypothetical protein